MAPKAPTNDNEKSRDDIDIREDIQLIKEMIMQTADDIRSKLKKRSDEIEENMFGFVKEHPVKTIAVSVVAGMILAKILQK